MSMDANIPPHVEDEVLEREANDSEAQHDLLEYERFLSMYCQMRSGDMSWKHHGLSPVIQPTWLCH